MSSVQSTFEISSSMVRDMRILSTCCAVLLLAASTAFAQEEAVLIDGVCARVNQDIITLSEFRRAQQDLLTQLRQQYSGSQLEEEYQRASKELLQNLIDTQLLVQKADELGITVEADINKYLLNIAKKNNVPPSKIDEMLKQMGFDPDQARQMLRVQFLRQRVIASEVHPKIFQNIFDKDVEAYYKEHIIDYTEPAGVKLSEIFIKTDGRTPEAARQLAEQLVQQLRAGADFAELAKKYSERPSASNGGQLGWFNLDPRPELGEAQRKAIQGKQVGEVTDPIAFPDGFLILRVDARREKKEKPLTPELRREITMKIAQQRLEPAVQEYIEQLRKDAYIEIVGPCKADVDEKTNADGTESQP